MIIRFIIEAILIIAIILGFVFEERIAIRERKIALRICNYFIRKGGRIKCWKKIKKRICENNVQHGLDITHE